MKFIRIVLIIGSITFFAWLFYWARFTPKQDISARIYQTLKEQETRADLSFKRVTFEEIQRGIKYWQLAAESAMVNKDTGLATLKNTSGLFYKAGRPTLRFHSPAAMWDMKKKEIYLDKPIGYDVAITKTLTSLLKNRKVGGASTFYFPTAASKNQGYWFQAANLSWKLADEQLLCTGGIKLSKGNVTGLAERLASDVGLETITLSGSPSITLNEPKSPPVTIEAETFDIINQQGLFSANGKPTIVWGGAKIEAEKATFIQPLQKLELTNNIVLNYQDIFATSNSANYLVASQELILEGQAQATQGKDHLSGDKLAVSLKDKKISLIGKSHVIITDEEDKL